MRLRLLFLISFILSTGAFSQQVEQKPALDLPVGGQGRWIKGLKESFGNSSNKLILLGTIGGAGLASTVDKQVKSYFEENRMMPVDVAELGRITGYYPAPLIVYSLVLLPAIIKNKPLSSVYADLEMITGAFLVNTAVVYSIKFLAGRERPDGSNTRSFPSGHSANSFLMASLIHQMYGSKAGLPFYGLASIVAASRLQHEKHYLSDVIMGAGIGLVIGRGFAKVYDRKTTSLSVIPVIQSRNNRLFTGLDFKLAF